MLAQTQVELVRSGQWSVMLGDQEDLLMYHTEGVNQEGDKDGPKVSSLSDQKSALTIT